MAKNQVRKTVETIKHDEATRKNIPTAEYQSVMAKEQQSPVRIAYERRNRDLDPQLVWRGKDEQDWSDLVVQAPPLYIQEKVHPKVLIDDLLARTKADHTAADAQSLLFADFNGVPEGVDKTDFYQHDQNWSNRMILGDSLQVMASLAEREGLRGRVQCIYFDPPYGIKFNSNFQWSTTSRDVKDGNTGHITREPEQVKAFRDTWRDGIHSYLTYLRDRLTVARDLLTNSGSIFVQIGDENVHRVRALMDEVFGDENFVSLIGFAKTTGSTEDFLGQTTDYLLWFCKDKQRVKYRAALKRKRPGEKGGTNYNRVREPIGFGQPLSESMISDRRVATGEWRIYSLDNLTSQSAGRDKGEGAASWFGIELDGRIHKPSLTVRWKTNEQGMARLKAAGRLEATTSRLGYVRYLEDFPAVQINNRWDDVGASFMADKIYVVQTTQSVIQRALLLCTDPGDLVLDPTCGSGTTAYVAEQWGRRWITIDTSRVALALARARVMGARYPFYLLADSREGQLKEAEVTRTAPSSQPVHGSIRQGFVYERVPHITLKSIANNAEIDVIWDKWQATLEPLRESLNAALNKNWQEWEIPREAEDPWDSKTQELFYRLRAEQERGEQGSHAKIADALQAINHNLKRSYTLETLPTRPADPWPELPAKLHADWWQARIARQQEIDKSIAAKAEFEFLYDKPYDDKKKVRVAGPFTVESLSPHRVLTVDENDELIDGMPGSKAASDGEHDFVRMILENLKTAGVQQAHKEDKITFTSLTPWPGNLICAEGRYTEGTEESGAEKRAAIFVGPEFGTVSRPDLVSATREAGDAGFDVLISCAFNYDAHSSEFNKLGRIPVLKARMNADLHMADDLKNTGKGNLFVIFGEPDIDILDAGPDGEAGQLRVKINGVDVFHPNTGEVRSDGAEGIACWFIDTDYNEESFFVRHAYFLGANDPYKALKTTLKAEINEEAWATLNSDTSRSFDKPKNGRIAVKVINHLGDEVMKVFRVD
jgi:adenine-specific DNA-methyltransferase